MERKSIKELEALKKSKFEEIANAEDKIMHLNFMLWDQRDYERYSEKYISINQGKEMSQYDFFHLVYKSLPGKYKKIDNIRYEIRNAFVDVHSDDDFFQMGDHLFKIGNSSILYNIESFIKEKVLIPFLSTNDARLRAQLIYKEDKSNFYFKLRRNIDKFIEEHPEYFI